MEEQRQPPTGTSSMILSVSIPSPPTAIPNPNPKTSPSLASLRSSGRRRRLRCRCRRRGESRWDPNGESFRFRFRDEEEDGEFGKRSGGRRWWSDETADEFDPFEEEEESIWDKIWIFKVFKAYGYMLPAIIGSMLLATGPKAFLIALALPLGQSAISLAIEKLMDLVYEGPEPRPKTRRRPVSRSYSNSRKQRKDESSRSSRGRNGYQSWVSADPGVTDRMNAPKRSKFGGWDELDDDQKGPVRSQSPTIGGSPQSETVKMGKLSEKERYRDAPLFLRLLIAVFPFLGSWTKIL